MHVPYLLLVLVLWLCPINFGLVAIPVFTLSPQVAPASSGGCALPHRFLTHLRSRVLGLSCCDSSSNNDRIGTADEKERKSKAPIGATNNAEACEQRCRELQRELTEKECEINRLRLQLHTTRDRLDSSETSSRTQQDAMSVCQSTASHDTSSQMREVGGTREPSWWHPAQVQEWIGARPIGTIMTSFPDKNGTPRQGSVAPASKARLKIEFGNNPQHSVEGLSDFSHVWLLFLFHDNWPSTPPRAKVKPPRLGGATKGVFATRAPHRPNPIGLSLCRLDRVYGHVLELSGVDLVDGTPILDVKPFIPAYDTPQDQSHVKYPTWSAPEALQLFQVQLTNAARADLRELEESGERPKLAATWCQAMEGLQQVLAADPRSVYRQHKCQGEIYPVHFDRLNAWCLFDDTSRSVAVERLFLADAGVRLVKNRTSLLQNCAPPQQ